MNIQIMMNKAKREIDFPFKVEKFGQVLNSTEGSFSYHYPNLEVCLRIASPQTFSEDRINGKTYKNSYPNVIFKIPGMNHTNIVEGQRETIFFTYSKETAEKLVKIGLLSTKLCHSIELSSNLKEHLGKLRQLMRVSQKFSIPDQIDLTCFAILEELCFQFKNLDVKIDGIRLRLQKIESYIKVNLNSELNFDLLAKQNGFSRRSFFRNWNKYYSTTPAHYVMNEKMRHAAELLIMSRMPICQISDVLNFSNYNYFATVFKKYYGKSPLDYRKEFIFADSSKNYRPTMP